MTIKSISGIIIIAVIKEKLKWPFIGSVKIEFILNSYSDIISLGTRHDARVEYSKLSRIRESQRLLSELATLTQGLCLS